MAIPRPFTLLPSLLVVYFVSFTTSQDCPVVPANQQPQCGVGCTPDSSTGTSVMSLDVKNPSTGNYTSCLEIRDGCNVTVRGDLHVEGVTHFSGGVKQTTTQPTGSIPVVTTLPSCTPEVMGQIVFLKDSAQLRVCDGMKWTDFSSSSTPLASPESSTPSSPPSEGSGATHLKPGGGYRLPPWSGPDECMAEVPGTCRNVSGVRRCQYMAIKDEGAPCMSNAYDEPILRYVTGALQHSPSLTDLPDTPGSHDGLFSMETPLRLTYPWSYGNTEPKQALICGALDGWVYLLVSHRVIRVHPTSGNFSVVFGATLNDGATPFSGPRAYAQSFNPVACAMGQPSKNRLYVLHDEPAQYSSLYRVHLTTFSFEKVLYYDRTGGSPALQVGGDPLAGRYMTIDHFSKSWLCESPNGDLYFLTRHKVAFINSNTGLIDTPFRLPSGGFHANYGAADIPSMATSGTPASSIWNTFYALSSTNTSVYLLSAGGLSRLIGWDGQASLEAVFSTPTPPTTWPSSHFVQGPLAESYVDVFGPQSPTHQYLLEAHYPKLYLSLYTATEVSQSYPSIWQLDLETSYFRPWIGRPRTHSSSPRTADFARGTVCSEFHSLEPFTLGIDRDASYILHRLASGEYILSACTRKARPGYCRYRDAPYLAQGQACT